jgi:hypothetical protein
MGSCHFFYQTMGHKYQNQSFTVMIWFLLSLQIIKSPLLEAKNFYEKMQI